MASFINTPAGDVVLVLSKAEAIGLRQLADEGAEGLLNDAAAARAYLGRPSQVQAAERALATIKSAVSAIRSGGVQGGAGA
jgi:hypothetical protein